MSETIISIDNIGKKYRLGGIGGLYSYKTLRDTLSGALKNPFARKKAGETDKPADKRFFWALKNLSLDVKQGEVMGVIGRNGAGKTTLLKILSQITEPTEGEVRLKGRVASLLEVGTGFHPELTGRENIFMNGAIMGMKRAETIRKFDEIVSFAEIEKFVDTPVKRYSSGMYVRLAFSVAAHLEPEILLVDEVLAVGDASFQKKCLGKMEEGNRREGRTVLFVSHNMAAVNALCSRSILIRQGKLVMDAPTQEVTSAYQSDSLAAASDRRDLAAATRRGSGKAKFMWIDIKAFDKDGSPLPVPETGSDIVVETMIECTSDFSDANLAMMMYDPNGYRLIDANTALKGFTVSMKAGQKMQARFVLKDLLIKEGTYFVGLWLGKGRQWEKSPWFPLEEIDSIEYATTLSIVENYEERKEAVVFPGPYLCRYDIDLDKE